MQAGVSSVMLETFVFCIVVRLNNVSCKTTTTSLELAGVVMASILLSALLIRRLVRI